MSKRFELFSWLVEQSNSRKYIMTSDIYKWGIIHKYTCAMRRAREFAEHPKSIIKRLNEKQKKLWELRNYKTREGIYQFRKTCVGYRV